LDGAQRVIIIFPAQVVLEKKEESNRPKAADGKGPTIVNALLDGDANG